jgi:hypothetical protein
MPASSHRLLQQAAMFSRVLSIENVAMAPNEHGLFTIDQVKALTSKRYCVLTGFGDCGCEIQHRHNEPVKIMATDRGLWSPVNIFRACRQAAGQPHYEIDYAKAKIKNHGNLDEVRVAKIVGADGVRPYLSRPSPYLTAHDKVDILRLNGVRELPDDISIEKLGTLKGAVGGWTWPLFCLFNCWVTNPGKSYDYRRAVRALDDAGLLKLTVGPRGGFGTATFKWLPLAHLQPFERQAPDFDPVGAEALADFAALG